MPEDPAKVAQTVWDRELVINKCRSSIDFQLWPSEIDSRIEPWLANFNDSEIEHAICLLNGLSFFSEKMIKQIFLSAIHELSSQIRIEGRVFAQERAAWQHFFDNILITTVTGETPSLADSGHMFARYSRDIIGFDEDQIASNDIALQHLLRGGKRTIVFVDDFVGSGSQFIYTWNRLYSIPSLGRTSFAAYAQANPAAQFFYCPAFCTEFGLGEIQKHCPRAQVIPGNMISNRYSAIDPNSIIWPDKLRPTAVDFLRSVSERAGIPDTNGNTDDWRGFNKLALSIAFAHGVPDATMPIFTWDKNGWNHLLRVR